MRIAITLLMLTSLGACIQEPADGRQIFQTSCAGCHGVDAMGAGDFGRHLIKQPPDLTMIAARNGGVFDRDAVMSVIDGLDRDSHFSAAMPEFGAGDMGDIIMTQEGDHTVPVPAQLLAIADYLESIQR